MGLDMYLSKRTYVKRWDHQKPENQHEVIVNRGGKPREDIIKWRFLLSVILVSQTIKQ